MLIKSQLLLLFQSTPFLNSCVTLEEVINISDLHIPHLQYKNSKLSAASVSKDCCEE